MTESDASLVISGQISAAVAHSVAAGRRIVDAAFYNKSADLVIVLCSPFVVTIDRNLIPELKKVPQDAMETLALSASGATVMIESHNVYIESAGLVAEFIGLIRSKKISGGLIFDLLQGP
jgi:hypothetical protein